MKRFLIILLVATSCAPVYVPNARNAPMFTGAGEVQVTAQISRGYEVQGAVAATNHLGVMGNYSFVSNTNENDDDAYIRHSFFEGGLGYYDNSGRLCYEVYGGYGRGKGTTYDYYEFISTDKVKATANYQRFFIQPSIGSNKNRIFNWAAVARFSFVDFTGFESNGMNYTWNHDPVLFIEPSFIGKINFGESKIMATFQAGLSFPRQDIDFQYEPLFLSVGLGLRLGALKE